MLHSLSPPTFLTTHIATLNPNSQPIVCSLVHHSVLLSCLILPSYVSTSHRCRIVVAPLFTHVDSPASGLDGDGSVLLIGSCSHRSSSSHVTCMETSWQHGLTRTSYGGMLFLSRRRTFPVQKHWSKKTHSFEPNVSNYTCSNYRNRYYYRECLFPRY